MLYLYHNRNLAKIFQRRFFSADRQRNKKLASVIREGLGLLNETALTIQNSSHTRRPLFPTTVVSSKSPQQTAALPSSDKARAEEHRIFTTAQECLESLATKHSIFTLKGEPISLLACRVKPSIQVATLFWTLPLSILVEDKLTNYQKEQLLEGVQKKWLNDSSAESLLQKCVHGKLSSYFPPKLRLEPAPEDMLEEYLQEWE
ncbi:hypothetical protein MPSEU_000967500 [Mayamaea pseudoterrestris]|nr:hypothetical protein MPSEU_000967500 [Mayamaea pseudoterrestris]